MSTLYFKCINFLNLFQGEYVSEIRCHSEIKNIPVASQPSTKCTGKGTFVASGQCVGTMESEKVKVV